MLHRSWNRLKATMQPVFRVIKSIRQALDVFMIILSPLLIIFIVVLVIMIPSNFFADLRELTLMEREGVVVWGTVIDSYNPDDEETYLGVMYPTYYKEDEIGLVRIAHYSPEQLLALPEGTPVQIRHLPNELGNTVMLEQYFDPPRNLWQINKVFVILLLGSWLIVAWHPEMLFLGYLDKFNPLELIYKEGK